MGLHFTPLPGPGASPPLFSVPHIMPTERISKLLDDIRLLDAGRFELVQALRGIILDLDPSISEEVKYGGLLFSSGKPFCGVFSYTKQVLLEFGEGASLPDAFQVLEGAGKFRRQIKLVSVEDIGGKHVRDYLVLARGLAAEP